MLHCAEASKTKQAIDKLRSELSAAEEAKRVSQCEAAAAREEAEKARLSREEAVARLQRAAEAAADGTEEAMRVVHEYDVATQQQQVPSALSLCMPRFSPAKRRRGQVSRRTYVCRQAGGRCAACWAVHQRSGVRQRQWQWSGSTAHARSHSQCNVGQNRRHLRFEIEFLLG